jgi:hypothetical protein
LEDIERRQDYLLLAQKSADNLRGKLPDVSKALERNRSDWVKLLHKDLTGYLADVVEGAKIGLRAEAQALEREKSRIEADLAALPQLDPAEVERELMMLAESWLLVSGGGRINPCTRHIMSWEGRSVATRTSGQDKPRKLSNEEARLLRETLLRLNARVIVQRPTITISGRLPMSRSAKASSLSTV